MISDHRDWFQKELTVLSDPSTEWSVVPTPFVGLFNDQMEIFVKQEGDDIFLSDDGITLWNAESAGFDGDEPRNWAKLNLILAKYGATLNDEKHIVKQVGVTCTFHKIAKILLAPQYTFCNSACLLISHIPQSDSICHMSHFNFEWYRISTS